MLTVSFREVGMDRDYICKGETKEEIMNNLKNMQWEIMDINQKT
jgi:hypothetical protein